MRRVSLGLAVLFALLPIVVAVQAPQSGAPLALRGLLAAAEITRDTRDIAHLRAGNSHDLYFLQGFVHAQDRLFQMDYSRRQASGTLAELLGTPALAADIQLRTFGLRRAAEASLPALSAETQAALDAYAEGVNAYVAANPTLPPEYGALGLTRFEPWTALDSVAVGKLIAFGLSFDLGDLDRTAALFAYMQAGAVLNFDGEKLFSEDLFRSAPFDPASTVPDAMAGSGAAALRHGRTVRSGAFAVDRASTELARRYLDQVKGLPLVQRYIKRDERPNSNEWAVAPANSASGRAMVANDPHLALDTPAVWYPVHQRAGRLDVIGNGFPGVPFVVLGHNARMGWGATVNPLDVTDVFAEQVVPDTASRSGLSIVHDGGREPIVAIPEVFRANVGGTVVTVPAGGSVPSATLIVPRRNNGPIIQLDLAQGTALSVAFTGFGATRELDTFRMFDEAATLDEFRGALRFFDFGSQNIAYADVDGNIAYFTTAEMPVRADLQAGTVVGLPPYFVRAGTTSANDWLPVIHPQPGQALPFEILPADEMPHTVNPAAGWFVNANNDPIGTTLDNDPLNQLRPGGGIYYLSPGYDGFRAGRATDIIRAKLANGGRVSFEDMQAMQADTVMIDAEAFVPYILQAFANAQTSSVPLLKAFTVAPGVAEAVGRLRSWNFSTPTGIPEGYDAVRLPGNDANSVAATIYAAWRGQFLANTIDKPLTAIGIPLPDGNEALTGLRHLLDTFATSHGIGGSGFNFFPVPSVPQPADARDVVILQSLVDGLALLSGDSLATVFHHSVMQDDYRWGLLHRIVFAHPLDTVFSIPPAGGAFPPPLAALPGIPTDGGFETLDRSDHDVRATTPNGFMFSHGPSNRSVHEGLPGGMRGVSSLPGGVSGVLGSPFYANLLTEWLSNVAYQQLQGTSELQANTSLVLKFVPAK